MKKIVIVAVLLGIVFIIQSCAAFYSCGTGGPVPQHDRQIESKVDKVEFTSINK